MAKQKATLKPTTRWVCISVSERVLDFTIAETRKMSQETYLLYLKPYGNFKKDVESIGVRCVKCRIVPFEGSKR